MGSGGVARVALTVAGRIVGVAVVTIAHAISVAVSVDAVGNAVTVTIATTIAPVLVSVVMALAALPAATVQAPAIIALSPFRALIVVAGACAFPMTSGPLMPSVIQIPITGRPFIAPAGSRNDFIPYRRRGVADDDVETYLRDRLRRDKGGSTENDCCGSTTEDAFHTNLQTICVEFNI